MFYMYWRFQGPENAKNLYMVTTKAYPGNAEEKEIIYKTKYTTQILVKKMKIAKFEYHLTVL